MVVPTVVVIDGLGDESDEIMADVISHEVADVHDGSIVFPAEPAFCLAFLLAANVTGVSTGDFLAGTEVLPQSVFEEGLAEPHFYEAAISPDGQRLGRCQQSARVDDTQQRHLLPPDTEHRIVEGVDVFLALRQSVGMLVNCIVVMHIAKVQLNLTGEKDIVR